MFNRGFRKSKCKSLVMIIVSRVTILRNRRDIQVRQLRRDLAQLLKNGQEMSARIRVESLVREQHLMEAYDIIQQFCEQIPSRIIVIEKEKDCPMDLQEAVESLIYAAPWCADLVELLKLRDMFAKKYGNRYITSIAERHSNCRANSEMISKLSPSKMTEEEKDSVLREIASEYNINWQPQVPLEKPQLARDLPKTSGQRIEMDEEFWSKVSDADESERQGGSSRKHKQKKETVATKQRKAEKENPQAIPQGNNNNHRSSVAQQARDLPETSRPRFDQSPTNSEEEDIAGTKNEEEFLSKISHQDSRQREKPRLARDHPQTSVRRIEIEEEFWSKISDADESERQGGSSRKHKQKKETVATKQGKAEKENPQAIPQGNNNNYRSSVAQQARDLRQTSRQRFDQSQPNSEKEDIVGTESEEFLSKISDQDGRQRETFQQVATKQTRAGPENSQVIPKMDNKKPSYYVAQEAWDLLQTSGQRRTNQRQTDLEGIVETESEEELIYSNEDSNLSLRRSSTKKKQEQILLKNCIKATEEAAKLAEQAAMAAKAVALFAKRASFNTESKIPHSYSIPDKRGYEPGLEENNITNNATRVTMESEYYLERNCTTNIKKKRLEEEEYDQFNRSYQGVINSSSSNQLSSLSSKEGSSDGKKNQKSESMSKSSSSRINTTDCQSTLLGKFSSLQHQPRQGLDLKTRTQSGPLIGKPQKPPDYDTLIAYFKQIKLERK